MEQLNYNHLYYFHVVAEAGTVAAAARRLSVTKPTVSNQVRQLESFLGRKLFDRRGGRLHLNPNGRAALKHTAPMFEAGRKLMHHFRGVDPEPVASIRIGVGTSVARTLGADFFAPLVELDSLRPSIRIASPMTLRSQLLAFETDLVLADSPTPEAEEVGVGVELLARSRLVLIANASLPAAPCVDDYLERHPLVQYVSESSGRWKVEEYVAARGLDVKPCAFTDDIPTMVSLVAAAPAVAVVPASVESMIDGREVRVVGHFGELQSSVYGLFMKRDVPELVRETLGALRRVTPSDHAA